MRPLLFLDFDDVICLNTKFDGYDAIEALGRLEREPGLSLGDPEFAQLWQGLFDEQARAHLKALDDEFQPVYVLSTSWRNFMNRPTLEAILRSNGLAFVAENLHDAYKTPRASLGLGDNSRTYEINYWLSDNPGFGDRWVVLDDEYSGSLFIDWHIEADRNYIVLCKVNVGLTAVEYELLREAFLRRLNGPR